MIKPVNILKLCKYTNVQYRIPLFKNKRWQKAPVPIIHNGILYLIPRNRQPQNGRTNNLRQTQTLTQHCCNKHSVRRHEEITEPAGFF